MKGEMASKHGSSNQRAHAPTYYEDTAAQPPPSLASAPSICRVCTEYEPTSTPKVHVNSSPPAQTHVCSHYKAGL